VPALAWTLGAAAVAAVALAFVLFPGRGKESQAATVQQQPSPRVELVYAAGDVLVDGEPIAFGSTLLSEGSKVEVGKGSACIAMDPGIDICAGEHTRFALSRVHSPWRRIDLLEGKVGVQLAEQPEGFRLSIVADDVWNTAIGTAFTVEHAEKTGVRTTVLNGKVRVGGDGGSERLVSAHQRADVQGERASVLPVGRSDESPEWALLAPAKLWSNPVSATLEVRGAPPGSEVLLNGQTIGVAPLSTLFPAGMHTLQIRSDGRLSVAREVVSEVGQRTAISFEGQALLEAAEAPLPETAGRAPAAEPRRQLEKLEPSAEPSAETVSATAGILSDARRLMRGNRFAEAAERYEALRAAYPQSPEAHTVLVSLAELQLDELGRPGEALRNLDLYLREGGGTLVEEARQARIRALRQLGRRAGEAEAISEFLYEHPRSFEAAALRRRLTEIEAQP
jgi:hypothetical protein